jgi:hypothetical protein
MPHSSGVYPNVKDRPGGGEKFKKPSCDNRRVSWETKVFFLKSEGLIGAGISLYVKTKKPTRSFLVYLEDALQSVNKKNLAGFLKSITSIEVGILFYFYFYFYFFETLTRQCFFPFVLGAYLEVPTGYHRGKIQFFLNA